MECYSKTNFSHSATEPANHSNASRWNSVAKPIFLIVLHNLQITATPILFTRSDKGSKRVDRPDSGSCPVRGRGKNKSGENNEDRDKVPQVPTYTTNTTTNKLLCTEQSGSSISEELISYRIRFSWEISYTTAKFATHPHITTSGANNYNRQRRAIIWEQIYNISSRVGFVDYGLSLLETSPVI